VRYEYFATVRHPAQAVLNAMLDDTPALLAFMPNVEEVKLLEREPRDGGLTFTRRWWQGSTKSAPVLLRPFLSKRALAWNDFSTWYPDRVEWRIEADKNPTQTTCSGITYVEVDPDNPSHSRMRLTGEFVVNPDALPGPKRLTRKIAPALEKIILGFMKPNLLSMADGCSAFLDAQDQG
jgi:hypothetical protein